jgi:hypothetical protein
MLGKMYMSKHARPQSAPYEAVAIAILPIATEAKLIAKMV